MNISNSRRTRNTFRDVVLLYMNGEHDRPDGLGIEREITTWVSESEQRRIDRRGLNRYALFGRYGAQEREVAGDGHCQYRPLSSTESQQAIVEPRSCSQRNGSNQRAAWLPVKIRHIKLGFVFEFGKCSLEFLLGSPQITIKTFWAPVNSFSLLRLELTASPSGRTLWCAPRNRGF